jgi:signal peptidase I
MMDYKVFEAQGNSMKPFIKNNDLIFVKKCRLNELVAGDIITYELIEKEQRTTNSRNLFCHRVLRMSKSSRCSVLTKGDAQDSGVWFDIGKDIELLGRVEFILKGTRFISNNVVYRTIGLFMNLLFAMCLKLKLG